MPPDVRTLVGEKSREHERTVENSGAAGLSKKDRVMTDAKNVLEHESAPRGLLQERSVPRGLLQSQGGRRAGGFIRTLWCCTNFYPLFQPPEIPTKQPETLMAIDFFVCPHMFTHYFI